MRYVNARVEKESLEKAYRIYVTDCLKYISENTSKASGGTSIAKRFIDIIERPPEETRTSEEIIDGVRSKLQQMEG